MATNVKNRKVLTLIGVVTLFSAVSLSAESPPAVKVQSVGEMRKVMRDGDLSAAIDLRRLSTAEHLYALGPVEGLKGEVTIWDGKPSIAQVRDGAVEVSESFEFKASFLVYSQVASWQEVPIPDEVMNEKQLAEFVPEAAKKLGINIEKPFPFAVKATPQQVIFHVLNKIGDEPHSREKHDAIKVKFAVEDAAVRFVGFYSESHHGVFTHHGSNVHLHVITGDGKQSGHVDAIQLLKRGTLLLPKS